MKSNTESRVLPSGLLLKTIEQQQQQHNTADEDDEYLQITYMAEVRCLNKENTKHKQYFELFWNLTSLTFVNFFAISFLFRVSRVLLSCTLLVA